MFHRRYSRKKKNTELARDLAKIYETYIGPFPGGIKNAYIHRWYPGHNQKALGAFSWSLCKIDPEKITKGRDGIVHDTVRNFSSIYPAKQAVKEPLECIEYGFYDDPLSELRPLNENKS